MRLLPYAVLGLALAACGSDTPKGDSQDDTPDAAAPDSGLPEGAPDYADPAMWMCRPGAPNDYCTSSDLTVTEVKADGSFARVEFAPAEDPPFDCFYVHPTQNFDREPGNAEIDPENPLYALRNQTARFVTLCRMFAPYYRQMTLGTYASTDDIETTEYFATAYGDVTRAFDHYMKHDNKGRPFVLLGHSQGTHMLVPLLKERFDGDQPERAQLISALMIGPVGRVVVPTGKLVGGTFSKLPLCSKPGERRCVVSYDSRVLGDDGSFATLGIPEGMSWACVNPAQLVDGDDLISASIWPVDGGIPFPDEAMSEPYVSYPEAYTAHCEPDGSLGIAARKGDSRNPIEPALIQAGLTSMKQGTSLHVVDYAFNIGDLLRVVAAQAAAK